MKLLVLLALFWLVKADTSNTQEMKQPKPTMKTINSVTVSQKPDYYQQPVQYQQPQYVQVVPKPLFQPQMIIIAQPAYVPANLVYGSATQQLLNYFHNNPQARYQLLHGYQPQQQYVHPNAIVAAAPTIGHYQYVAAPTQYQQPAQNQLPFAQTNDYHQTPAQLGHIAHLAQLAAQQYVQAPVRGSTPAIITGFENFTPDQQAKIKAQLSAHFGTPLQPLQQNGKPEVRYVTGQQYPIRYQQALSQSNNDFVPSQQIKSDTSGTGATSESLKSQYHQKM